MSRLRLVAVNTYARQVFQKGFLASLLIVPTMVVLILGLLYLVETRDDRRPVGYVDNAGVLTKPLPPLSDEGDKLINLVPYATTDAARSALKAGHIQAYYVVPTDYRETGQVELIYASSPDAGASEFRSLVRYNLLRGEPDPETLRIVGGASVTVRQPDGRREFPASAGLADVAPIFVVLFMALGFVMLLGLNPGQPMLVVAEEKENRTMEIMVTSVAPGTLIAGKVLGAIAVAGTLVSGWLLLAAVAIVVAVRVLRVDWLQGIHLPPSTTLLPLGLYLPLYVMLAALMAGIGATVVEAREGQQLSAIFIIPMMIPFYVLELVLEHSDSPITILLSLFPLTSPTVMAMRVYSAGVPAWQIALSFVLSIVCAVGAIWLAGRAFRLGMLRYGQPLRWREVLRGEGGTR